MPNAKTSKSAVKSASPKQVSVVPVDFFGPPPLLEGEDEAAYAGLLERVQEAVKPRDVLEQIATRDFVDITWEIFRLRRLREPVIIAGHADVIERMLKPLYGYKADDIRNAWLRGDAEAIDKVAAMLAQCSYTLDDVHARALAARIDVIERLDRMVAQAEHRRRLVIGELDRRRDALARRLREAVGVIDVELGSGGAAAARLPAPAAGTP
jgi:flagellin-specific chaperone FliS